MRIEYLAYLLEVARLKSISRAAKSLYIGQTTLSAIIQSLERDMDIQMFERTNRGVTLTVQGEQAVKIIEEIVEKSRQLQMLGQKKNREESTIHLVLMPCISNALSLQLTRNPAGGRGPALWIRQGRYDSIVQDIAGGTAHIGVGADYSPRQIRQREARESSVCYEAMFADQFFLMVGGDSPLLHREQIGVEELAELDVAISDFFATSYSSPLREMMGSFQSQTVFADNQVMKHAVAQNNIAALLPGLSLREDPLLRDGVVRLIPLDIPVKIIHYLAWKEGELSASGRLVLEEIRQFYRAIETAA